MTRLLCGFFVARVAFAQSPSFDVASIKPSPPYTGGPMRVGSSGGPGTKDPGLFRCENCSLSDLVTQAFGIRRYQLTAPVWMESERFELIAKLPADATKEQFQLMLQNVLADRFRLAVHHEQKEMAMYDLVIAKGGSKLKESVPVEAPVAADRPSAPVPFSKMELDADGYPVLNKDGSPGMIMMNGKARSRSVGRTGEQIAGLLASQVGKPVTDRTGLTGKYDFVLSWATGDGARSAPPADGGVLPAAPDDTGQNIFAAIQSQLGLKLVEKRGPVDMVVVDHAGKVPSDN